MSPLTREPSTLVKSPSLTKCSTQMLIVRLERLVRVKQSVFESKVAIVCHCPSSSPPSSLLLLAIANVCIAITNCCHQPLLTSLDTLLLNNNRQRFGLNRLPDRTAKSRLNGFNGLVWFRFKFF